MLKICKTPKENTTCKIFVTEAQIEDGQLVIYGQDYGEALDQFTTLTEELQAHGPRLCKLNNPQPDKPCICMFKADEQWYRAIIVRKLASGEWVVKFIDYGNSEKMKIDELHVLPDKLATLPQQALTMFLGNSISPVGTAGVWTPVVTNLILNNFMYTDVTVTVTKVLSPGRVTVECSQIETVLCESGYAKQGLCYPFSKFFVDLQFKAYTSNILNDGTLYFQELQSASQLDELMDQMSRHFATKENKTPLTKKNLLPGTLMAAVYSQDQGIYRAQILDVDGESSTVRYIDYGDSEQQELVNMFVLPKQFCELEYQAIPCSLHEVAITPGLCSPKLSKVLSNCTADSILDVTVIAHKFDSHVQLEVKALRDGTNICIFLCAEGLADPKPKTQQITVEDCVAVCDSEICLGKAYNMIIAHVDDDGIVYLMDVNNTASLNSLMDEVAAYCCSTAAESMVSVTEGMLCCALYDTDGMWYRAKVLSVDGDNVTVKYVDYGNTASTKCTSLKKLNREHSKLPCQAVQARLLSCVTKDQVEKLKGLTDEEVEAKFTKGQPGGQYEVSMVYQKKSLFCDAQELQDGAQQVSLEPKLKFKKFNLQVGSVEVITVSHVTSPEVFWARCSANQSEYQSMMEELNETYGMAKDLSGIDVLKPGMVCAAFDKEKWYRGKVVQCNEDDISVFLVDSGNCIVISKEHIRYLCPNFIDLPTQALKCSLDDKKPISERTLQGSYNLLIKAYDQATSVYKVELHSDKLGKTGLSATIKSASTLTLPSVVGTDHSSNLENLYSPCVSLGTFVPVNVCFVEDPDCLWVQQGCNEKQLYTLMHSMKTYYALLAKDQGCLDETRTDKLCCIKMCHVDNVEDWYRGRILCSYGNTVEIKLIDFGNDISVNRHEVKMLAPQFFEPKAQALRCQMNNVQPMNKKWTKAALHKLKDLVLRHGATTMGCFVKKQNLTYHIDLVVEKDGQKLDIAKTLCDGGHASRLQPTTAVPSSKSPAAPIQSQLVNDYHAKPVPKVFYRSPGMAMVGAELQVIACTSKSPDEFFLQIVDQSYRQRYIKLFRKLYNFYSNKESIVGLSGNMYIGKPCAIFDEKTGDWCRAAVLSFADLDNVALCLVDIGRIVCAKFTDLKEINLGLVNAEPPAALRCTLRGTICPTGGSWSEGAVDLFKEFFHENTQELVCTIHGCIGDTIGMAFMCSLKTPSTNIAVELMKRGFCEQVPVLGTLAHPFWLKSFVYSNLDVTRGKEDDFHITHVENSKLFYCQLERNFGVFDMMMDKLQEHCLHDRSPLMSLEEITQECMCFAKYQGEQWCRAHFVSALSDGNVQVLFVDYGNVDSVCWGEIKRHAGNSFYQVPIMALPCCLSDMANVQTNTDQSEKICRRMREKILEKLFTGIVTGYTNGKLHLDLFENGNRINDEIVGQLLPQQANPVKTSSSSSSDTDEEIISSRLHAELSDAFFLRVGSKEPVEVTNCMHPRHFYLQLCRLKRDQLQCKEAVDGFYTAVRNSDYPVFVLNPGDTVCAWHEKNARWCRATVLSVAQTFDGSVDVLYVDTGEYGKVNKNQHVKQLVEEMLKWPKMSVPSSLAGIQPKPSSKWSPDAIALFNSVINSDSLCAKFLHKDDSGSWMIKLSADEDDVAQRLVENDFASWNDEECRAFDIHPVSPTLKPTYLMPGQTEKVYISHVDSHEIVFLQKVETYKNLGKMMANINKDVDKLEKFHPLPNTGDTCLAKYDVDGLLYRARIVERILSNYAEEATLFVQFVDYGNAASMSVDSVFRCPAKYLKDPEFAVRCKVLNIPSGVDQNDVILKLGDLSISEDVTILCSTNCLDSAENCHKVNLKIRSGDRAPLSLPGFWSADKKSNSEPTENNDLPCYKEMENLEGLSNKQVYICHVVNPGEVYCQLSECCEQLEVLTNNISAYLAERVENANDKISSVKAISAGSSCVAKFSSDKNWYRAIVVSIPDSTSVLVRFVDFGNEEVVALSDIRHSKVSFCLYPIQAIHCQLVSVPSSESHWSKEQINAFDSRVAAMELCATFNSYNEEKKIYQVMLRLPDGTLLNKEYSYLEEREDEISSTKECSTLDSELQTKVTKVQIDTNASGRSGLGDTDLIKKPEIEPGSVETAYICYAEDPGNFYVQLSNCVKTLDSIQQCVNADAEEDAETIDLVPNLICVAKSPEDGVFYRAKITNVSQSKAVVFFIDYGNKSSIERSCIKPISSKTLEFSAQSIPCYLDNVPVYSREEDIKEAIDFFLAETLDNEIIATFLELKPNGRWKVNIQVDGKDLSQQLQCKVNDDEVAPTTESNKLECLQERSSTKSDEIQTATESEKAGVPSCQSSDTSSSLDDNASSVLESGLDSEDEKPSSPHLSPIPSATLRRKSRFDVCDEHDKKLPMREFCNGEMHMGTVISASCPAHFYVRLDNDPDIHTVMEEIKYPAEGDNIKGLCIAKLKPEDNWQRAEVHNKSDGTKTLFFLDSGKVINSKRFLIATIPDNLMNIPATAICCNLEQTGISNGEEQFACNVVGQHVLIMFRTSGTYQVANFKNPKWSVELFHLTHVLTTNPNLKTEKPAPETSNFDPCAVSTPLLPEIMITGVDGVKKAHDQAHDAVALERSSVHALLQQLKNLIVQEAPNSQLLEQAERLIIKTASSSDQLIDPSTIGADGDKSFTTEFQDDHKRPSSPLKDAIESPCKKPRLDEVVSICTNTRCQLFCNEWLTVFQQLSEQPICAGDVHEGFVSHVNTPESFYIKPYFLLADRVPCSNFKPSQLTECIEKFVLCLMKVHDKDEFVRCIVVGHEDDWITVFNIDSGVMDNVQKDQLFKMPDEYKTYPPLAVHCSLALEQHSHASATDIIKVFADLTNNERSLRVEFVKPPPDTTSKWTVRLTADSTDISDLLCKTQADLPNQPTDENFCSTQVIKPARVCGGPLLDIGPTFRSLASVSLPSISESEVESVKANTYVITPLPVTMSSESSLSVISDSVFVSENEGSGMDISPDMPKRMSWSIYHSSSEKAPSEIESTSQSQDVDTAVTQNKKPNEDRVESATCLDIEIDQLVKELVDSSLTLNQKFSVFEESTDQSQILMSSSLPEQMLVSSSSKGMEQDKNKEKNVNAENPQMNEDDEFMKIAQNIVEQVCNKAVAIVVDSHNCACLSNSISPCKGFMETTNEKIEILNEELEDGTVQEKTGKKPEAFNEELGIPEAAFKKDKVESQILVERANEKSEMDGEEIKNTETAENQPLLTSIENSLANEPENWCVEPDLTQEKSETLVEGDQKTSVETELDVEVALNPPELIDTENGLNCEETPPPCITVLVEENDGQTPNSVLEISSDADVQDRLPSFVNVDGERFHVESVGVDELLAETEVKVGVTDSEVPEIVVSECPVTEKSEMCERTIESIATDFDVKNALIEDCDKDVVQESFGPDAMKDQFLSTPKHCGTIQESEETSIYGTPLSEYSDGNKDHDTHDVTLTHDYDEEISDTKSPQDDLLFVSAREDSD